jgi:hypothetical protein
MYDVAEWVREYERDGDGAATDLAGLSSESGSE